MAGYVYGDEWNREKPFKGRIIPTARQTEENIGCYIYGKIGDSKMFEHTGLGDSIWKGEMKKKWQEEGRKIIGG